MADPSDRSRRASTPFAVSMRVADDTVVYHPGDEQPEEDAGGIGRTSSVYVDGGQQRRRSGGGFLKMFNRSKSIDSYFALDAAAPAGSGSAPEEAAYEEETDFNASEPEVATIEVVDTTPLTVKEDDDNETCEERSETEKAIVKIQTENRRRWWLRRIAFVVAVTLIVAFIATILALFVPKAKAGQAVMKSSDASDSNDQSDASSNLTQQQWLNGKNFTASPNATTTDSPQLTVTATPDPTATSSSTEQTPTPAERDWTDATTQTAEDEQPTPPPLGCHLRNATAYDNGTVDISCKSETDAGRILELLQRCEPDLLDYVIETEVRPAGKSFIQRLNVGDFAEALIERLPLPSTANCVVAKVIPH